MKILVCLGNVPDTTTKVRFGNDGYALEKSGIQWIINPWDELALTRAIELKEDSGNSVSTVSVVTVGEVGSESTIRKALAIGADDAVRIDADPSDAYSVAAQIADAVKEKDFDLIMCGIESSDYNGSGVGGMLAEFLNIPSVSAVSSITINGDTIELTREIDGGREVLGVSSPILVIVQKGIAKEPRIPAMRGIMMARQKPLVVIKPTSFESLVQYSNFRLPSPKPPCRMINPENVSELVELLQNEARVI